MNESQVLVFECCDGCLRVVDQRVWRVICWSLCGARLWAGKFARVFCCITASERSRRGEGATNVHGVVGAHTLHLVSQNS